MTRPPARDGGFTLLELLVALVVFGFLLAGLGQGVHFGLQAWTRQTRSIAARDGLDAVDRALRGLITRLDPDAEVGGRAHALAFTSDLPLMARLPAPAADLLLLVDAQHRLVLRWLPHRHAQRLGPPPPPRDEVMLEEVERVDIAYWATSGTWVDRWTDRAAPPALIRVRLVFAPGDPRRWPDLVAAPMRVRQ